MVKKDKNFNLKTLNGTSEQLNISTYRSRLEIFMYLKVGNMLHSIYAAISVFSRLSNSMKQ